PVQVVSETVQRARRARRRNGPFLRGTRFALGPRHGGSAPRPRGLRRAPDARRLPHLRAHGAGGSAEPGTAGGAGRARRARRGRLAASAAALPSARPSTAALPSARRPRRAASERQASEERPGFAGALPSVGGLGGPFVAPHLNRRALVRGLQEQIDAGEVAP